MNIFRNDIRLTIVVVTSVAAALIASAVIVLVAQKNGLDPVRLTGDASGYVKLAYGILNHQVFSIDPAAPFYPQSFRTPGYPFFASVLLGIFSSEILVLFIQSIIVSVAVPFLYLLVRPFHERAAFWGSIIFALEPIRLFLASSFLSDALFAAILLLSLLLLEHARKQQSFPWYAAVGISLGVLMLVRPIAMFLPFLYALYLLVQHVTIRRALIGSLIMCAVSLATIFP